MLYNVSVRAVLNGLLHVRTLREERGFGFGEMYRMEIQRTGWSHSTASWSDACVFGQQTFYNTPLIFII